MRGTVRAGALDVVVDLEVGAGETVALLGPNGAGKTTVLQAIAGLRSLAEGTLVLDGRVLDSPVDGTHVPPEERGVGVVFQDVLLFEGMDVTANVAFGLRARGASRRAAEREAADWLARLGLGQRATARPRELSGGEAQRVALARALASRPRALLLDEPLSSLDADVRADVRRQLRDHLDLHAGPCVVVTHDPLDAAVLGDRVVVLEHGRQTHVGTLEELVERPRTAWTAELAGTNLLPATASGHSLVLESGGSVTAAEAPGDGPVLVAVRPAAVALHRRHPEGSPRNVWAVRVGSIEGFGERVRVRLSGDVALVAEVTQAAVGELGLEPGLEVWASVKATEVAAYPA